MLICHSLQLSFLAADLSQSLQQDRSVLAKGGDGHSSEEFDLA
jgi:hypothetical protein